MEFFFNKWINIISNEGKIEEINNLHTIPDKLLYVMNCDVVDKCNHLNLRQDCNRYFESLTAAEDKFMKCKERSYLLKKQGIQAYVSKKTAASLKFFNEALRYAPPGDGIVPLLYGNRSAALFRLKLYAECVADIRRALDFDCAELKLKLLIRKIKCHIELKERSKAYEDIKHLQKNFESEIKTKYNVDVVYLERQIKELQEVREVSRADEIPSVTDIYYGPSSMFPQMSDALQIRENKKHGRHVVAREPLKKGSVLFVEEPFASGLLSSNCYEYCNNCFKYSWNPITCDKCVDVVWCCEECRRVGMKIHRYECTILHVFTSMGVAHLAIKTVLEAGWNSCLNTEERLANLRKSHCNTQNELQYLISQFEETNDFYQMQYCLLGYILGLLLIRRTDFVPTEHRHCSNYLLKFSSFLAENVARLACNAHTISKVTTEIDSSDSMVKFKNEVVGSGLYVASSIMNHSCQPLVMKIFDGKTLVVRAKTDIEAGCQVFDSYGPCTSKLLRKERRELLIKQYFFDCDCPDCTNDQADIKEANWYGVKCLNCFGVAQWTDEEFSSLECLSCKTLFDPPPSSIIENCITINNLYQEGVHLLSDKMFEAAEEKLTKALAKGEKTFCERNMFLNKIRSDYVKTLLLNEKFTTSLKNFEKWFKFSEERFGKYGIDSCNSLLGFLVIMDRIKDKSNIPEIVEMDKKIEEILILTYGSNWKQITTYAKFETQAT